MDEKLKQEISVMNEKRKEEFSVMDEKTKVTEELYIKEAKKNYPDLPDDFINAVVHDYLLRPEYYEKIYEDKQQIPKAKDRDTQESIKEQHASVKDSIESVKDSEI